MLKWADHPVIVSPQIVHSEAKWRKDMVPAGLDATSKERITEPKPTRKVEDDVKI
jgi:hypothetical protein